MKTTKLSILFLLIFLFTYSLAWAQTGSVSGVIRDKKTQETIVGANVKIKGTMQGASTDFDGNFLIENLAPGKYTFEISYISYTTAIVENVEVLANKIVSLKVDIEEQSTSLAGVSIVSEKRTDSELSVMSIIKSGNLVASGVSAQQISRTQDRDVSEVVKRIPGVTIIDNRFIIVRGLNERYNTVWLNNASTPSSESDIKAFSFDVIPSSMLERVMVYKTPAPELPADFAGGAVQIFTKNSVVKNFINVSFSGSYRSGTTFQPFFISKGSSTDWLGFDNGFRALPSSFPDYTGMIALSNSTNAADNAQVQQLGREMNKVWSAYEKTARPDLRFAANIGHRFKLKGMDISNITSINYSNTFNHLNIYRADYESYDTLHDKSDTSYSFYDKQYTNTVKASVLFNWSFRFSDRNKIEFRNLFNQIGYNKTTIRDGKLYTDGSTIRANELRYQSRTTYSTQLGGVHTVVHEKSKMDWNLGFAYANKREPDLKRITFIKITEDPDDIHYGQYAAQIPFAATPEMTGRLYVDMDEYIYNASANYEDKLSFGGFKPELKAGFYLERKNRAYNTRNIGYKIAKTSTYNWNIPFLPVDSLFLDTNINNVTGIRIDEKTNASDLYTADNTLLAAYFSFKIPIKSLFNIYTGVRMEQNTQRLNSAQIDNPTIPVNINNEVLNFFPSISLTYDLSERSLFRLAYGMTINRPEFREIAPMLFYDFELKSGVRGNPELKNAYIYNYDFRYEFYPTPSESFLIGAFYKKFINPIESKVIPSGSGLDYSFTNADAAMSYGVEFEMRKSLQNLGKKDNVLRYLKNLSLVANATLIKSEVQFSDASLELNRPLQGQSPYIINAGLYYQNDSIGLSINFLYNVVGKRIVTVGNPYQDTPDIYEMPRNLADLTISQRIGEHFTIKASVQDIFNNPYIFRQTITFNQDTDGDGAGDTEVSRIQDMRTYSPGTYFSLGATWNL